MRVNLHTFTTLEEARGFADGVERYSPCDITVCPKSAEQAGPEFVVAIHDESEAAYWALRRLADESEAPLQRLAGETEPTDVCPLCESSGEEDY